MHKWYAIHAHTEQENRVKENLLKSLEDNDMSEFVSDVLVPSEEVAEVKGGVKRVSRRKFFPGYVLVRMELNDDTWYLIKKTPGVSGFIGPGNKPVPLRDEEVERILEQMKGTSKKPKPLVSFEANERVKIIEGPFANFEGTVAEVNPERGKLKVMVEIFERQTSVELEFWQVERT